MGGRFMGMGEADEVEGDEVVRVNKGQAKYNLKLSCVCLFFGEAGDLSSQTTTNVYASIL